MKYKMFTVTGVFKSSKAKKKEVSNQSKRKFGSRLKIANHFEPDLFKNKMASIISTVDI